MTTNLVLPMLAAVALLQGPSPGLIEELDAQPPRTGYFLLSASPAELLGFDDAQELNPVVAAEEPIVWQVYVPRNYDPREAAGLVVFIPSGGRGRMPFEWQTVMDAHGLIWVSANDSGGSAPVPVRMLKAILAPRAVDREYHVDTRRIYVGGYIDGGAVAGLVQAAEPEVFKGSLYVCGAMFWDERVPDRLDLVLQNRHVFIRGCIDHLEREVKNVYEQYIEAGAVNAELISLHPSRDPMPQREYVERAFAFLDPLEPGPEPRASE